MNLETMLVSLYVLVDDWWAQRAGLLPVHRRAPPPLLPPLLSHGQFNRRVRALEPELKAFQRDLAETLADGSEVYHVLDTTLIPAIVRVRACRMGLFAGEAYPAGRCVSKTEWVFGFKVALSVSPEGVIY